MNWISVQICKYVNVLQWKTLCLAIQKYGPNAFAAAAMQDIRLWTLESLKPNKMQTYSKEGFESFVIYELQNWSSFKKVQQETKDANTCVKSMAIDS